MPQRVKFLLAVLTLTTVLLTGCGGQETPVEQAEAQADAIFDEAFAEAQQRGSGTTVQDVLSERGYDCGWVEYQESKGQ